MANVQGLKEAGITGGLVASPDIPASSVALGLMTKPIDWLQPGAHAACDADLHVRWRGNGMDTVTKANLPLRRRHF
jgi:hypothetical protein